MHSFCTLFDSFFLSRGLALYFSLRKQLGNQFHLYIFAFDNLTLEILRKLSLPAVTVIPLSDFEDSELLKVKPSRTKGEYCWTSTPSTILYCLQKYSLTQCTYLDADLFFFSSPAPLFNEMGDASVLITPHRYTPCYDQTLLSGKYCVQFMSFKNNPEGMTALSWWRSACLDWCYARCEEGKFGDQKYLDDWPTRFTGVWELKHLGGGVAPWNVQQYDFHIKDDRMKGVEYTTQQEFELIFFHFHQVRHFRQSYFELGDYQIDPDMAHLIYWPYLRTLLQVEEELTAYDSNLRELGKVATPHFLRHSYRRLKAFWHKHHRPVYEQEIMVEKPLWPKLLHFQP